MGQGAQSYQHLDSFISAWMAIGRGEEDKQNDVISTTCSCFVCVSVSVWTLSHACSRRYVSRRDVRVSCDTLCDSKGQSTSSSSSTTSSYFSAVQWNMNCITMDLMTGNAIRSLRCSCCCCCCWRYRSFFLSEIRTSWATRAVQCIIYTAHER